MRAFFVFVAMACLLIPAAMALGIGVGIIPPPPPLSGVERAIPQPVLSASSLWSGAYARQMTAWLGRNNAAVPAAVAARNQAYFSLLRQARVADLVVGRDLELMEAGYIIEYCGRDVAAMRPAAEDWAEKLEAIQRWYASQNRVFIYVVTPDKPATYPEYIPNNWPCHSSQADRVGKMAMWRDLLTRHGIAFVDGPAIMAAAKPNFPIPLFPRGGTHWNWLGAGLEAQALVHEIDRQRPKALPDFTFTWRLAEPVSTDRDLTDLLNLPYPRLDYTAPMLDIRAPKPPACQVLNLAAVGDSFTFHLLALLDRLPCPPESSFYPYFKMEHVSYPGRPRSDMIDPAESERQPLRTPSFDSAARDRQLCETADIVLLEENENNVFHSPQMTPFWGLLQPRIQASQAAAR